jgi:hypothetical protein
VSTSARSRACAASVSSSFGRETSRQYDCSAPRPTAAKLVELGEPEPVCLLDDHDRRVRDVDAHLDHGGRDEHVELRSRNAHHLAALGRPQAPVQGPTR